jgi:hypothetical protein
MSIRRVRDQQESGQKDGMRELFDRANSEHSAVSPKGLHFSKETNVIGLFCMGVHGKPPLVKKRH